MTDLTLQPIPDKPHWHLGKTQKDCLDASLFFPEKRERLYSIFVDSKCTPVQSRSQAKQLFEDPTALEYLEVRKRWIEDNWFQSNTQQEQEQQKPTRLSKEQRQELAELLLDNFLQSPNATDPTMLKKALDFALDKVEENREEKPRLYVPIRCNTCAYRAFCEANGESICQMCKYREYAIENGMDELNTEKMLNDFED